MRSKPTARPRCATGTGGATARRAGTRRARGSPCGALPVSARAAALACGLALTPSSGYAGISAIACGSHYTVVRGDTLFSIAARAYGDGGHFKAIFETNQDVLTSLDSIEIGNRLLVPCLDGTAPGSRPIAMPVARSTSLRVQASEQTLPAPAPDGTAAGGNPDDGARIRMEALRTEDFATGAQQRTTDLDAPVQPGASAASPAPASPAFAASVTVSTERQVIFLAGSVAPYADRALPRGGMVTDLISQALETAAPGWPYTVGFPGGWSPPGPAAPDSESFDIAFPAVKPDCADRASLSPRTRHICDSYVFSRPIVLAEMAYYGRAGDPVLRETSAAGLAGRRICTAEEQPEAAWNPLSAAEPYGPGEPAPALERCFELLAGGETDIVMGLKAAGDTAIGRLGLGGAITEIGGLRSTQTLHAIAPKGNAYAIEVLKALDRGIGDLMISGRWFEIVSSHETDRVAFLAR